MKTFTDLVRVHGLGDETEPSTDELSIPVQYSIDTVQYSTVNRDLMCEASFVL